jgi:hypothetical protein
VKKPIGITFQAGVDKKRISFNVGKQVLGTIRPLVKKDGKMEIAPNGGLRLDLTLGTFKRPIPKFWKKEFWSKSYVIKNQATNPWNSGNYWFVINIPWFPSFFFSACYGQGKNQPGFYIGWKTYRIMDLSQGNIVECQLKKYRITKDDEFIFDKEGNPVLTWCTNKDLGNIYTCLSASIRGDLVED